MNPEAITRFAGVAREFAESSGSIPGPGGASIYPSDRELEAAYLFIVDGLTVREIGKRLEVSAKTIEVHHSHFRVKCALTSTHSRYGSWMPLIASYYIAVGRDEARAELVAS